MKKIIYTSSVLLLAGVGLKAQPVIAPGASPDWKVGSNTVSNSNVIGPFWAAGGAPSQMWFTTGAAAPQYRMTIFGGGVNPTDGFVGMGNNLPAAFVPQSRLHLHQTAGNTFIKFSNAIIGAAANDGLSIGNTQPGFAFYTNFEPGQPHAFFTNDGTASGTFERMRINAINQDGFIGMGNSAAFAALSQLHINTIGANISTSTSPGEVFRTEGLNSVDNNWRLFTGAAIASTTQKGRIFASPTGTPHVNGVIYPVDQYFNFEATQADMVFKANGTLPVGSTPPERMRVTSDNNFMGTGVDVTRVSITRDATGAVADPRAMLHIGQPFNVPGARGHRKWMDVGTYYSTGGDMMYVGQHNLAPGQNNAIIAFGSEPVNFNNPAPPGDRLLFQFNDDPGFGNGASGTDGLEIARMVSDGNNGRMSVGTPTGALIDPGNTLEIISSAGSPRPAGLRFRNLNCLSPTTPLCNPSNPVYLSVDNNGDVILVNAAASSSCCLGNLCGTPTNPLLGDYEIPMNKFNFNFTDPSATLNDGQNFVRIGGPCGTPRAKLDVLRTFTNNTLSTVNGTFLENQDMAFSSPFSGTANAAYGLADGQNSANYGFHGEAVKASSNIGVGALSTDSYFGGSNAISNIGFEARVADGLNNTGITANASNGNPMTQNNTGGNFSANSNGPNINTNYGVQSMAFNNSGGGIDNIGVFSQAFNFNTINNNVGVVGISSNFGSAANDIGLYGESTTGGFAAYFAGPTISGPAIVFSDNKLKKDVKAVENATELLNKLKPVTYLYNTDKYPNMGKASQLQYGFIAQDVQQAIPELVLQANKPEFKDKEGKIISKGEELIGINYDAIIPILTKSLQEQAAEMESVKKELAELKEMLKAQGNNQSTGSNNIGTIELSDTKSIVLDQNVPNPFAEQTTIQYVLPENVQRAQMLFYNSDGKLINSMELTERGKGILNVFANDLSNGVYTYTLVVDGKIVDSKRMIRNK